MKKLVAVILMLVVFTGIDAMAIGLPNNAYIQRHATLNANKTSKQAKATDCKIDNLLTSQVKEGYADDHASTLDSASDLKEFSQAIVNRVVGFVSMILLSLSSFGSSLADEMHIVHTWMLTDLPPQV